MIKLKYVFDRIENGKAIYTFEFDHTEITKRMIEEYVGCPFDEFMAGNWGDLLREFCDWLEQQ